VPCPSEGLWAPAKLDPTESECSDWASQSRDRVVVAFGVATDAKETLVELRGMGPEGRFNGGGIAEEEEEDVVLKADRRFCAEDLRRMVGRCGSWAKCDIIVVSSLALSVDDST